MRTVPLQRAETCTPRKEITMPAPAIQLEDLLDLAEELYGAGFNLSTQQYVAAQDLLILLAAQGQLHADPYTWRTLLAPVFCSSPREQEDFYQRFDGWLNRHPALMEFVEEQENSEQSSEQSSKGYDTEQKIVQITASEQPVPAVNSSVETGSQTLRAMLKQPNVWLPLIAVIFFQALIVFLALRTQAMGRFMTPLLGGIVGLPVLFALWYVGRFLKRQMILQKLQAKETPSLFRISVKGAA